MIENYSKKLKEVIKKNEEIEQEVEFYRNNFDNLEQTIQDVQMRLEESEKENKSLKEIIENNNEIKIKDAEKMENLGAQIL